MQFLRHFQAFSKGIKSCWSSMILVFNLVSPSNLHSHTAGLWAFPSILIQQLTNAIHSVLQRPDDHGRQSTSVHFSNFWSLVCCHSTRPAHTIEESGVCWAKKPDCHRPRRLQFRCVVRSPTIAMRSAADLAPFFLPPPPPTLGKHIYAPTP